MIFWFLWLFALLLTEAEYAFQKRKTIIPLISQRGYRPDGWLGLILGTKLFYDFSGKYLFQTCVDSLLKGVCDAIGKEKEVALGPDQKETTSATLDLSPAVEQPVVRCVLMNLLTNC